MDHASNLTRDMNSPLSSLDLYLLYNSHAAIKCFHLDSHGYEIPNGEADESSDGTVSTVQ